MADLYYIGSSPCDEACAQVGEANYAEKARTECRAFIEQLRRQFGPEPDGVRLITKGSPHDFGTYYEVVARVESDAPEASWAYAAQCEDDAAPVWDEEAHAVLAQAAWDRANPEAARTREALARVRGVLTVGAVLGGVR